MKHPPTLNTNRLLLRPLELADAAQVQRLAGDREIARTTLSIPHPYEDGMAEAWIAGHQDQFERGELVNFAIVGRDDQVLMGAIGLVLTLDHARAELGYWLGRPYWGRGFVTEAARAVVAYGFGELNLNRIHASYMAHNAASGRVMEKLGMRYEGRQCQHLIKWGECCDIILYGMVKADRQAQG